jgi:hypothetical protein
MTKFVVNKANLNDISKDVIEIVIKKNADYGDAWQRFGPFTPLIRLNDKLLRVETLSSGQRAMVVDEDLTQTIVDIIGYSFLLLGYFRVNGKLPENEVQPTLFPEDKLEMLKEIVDLDEIDAGMTCPNCGQSDILRHEPRYGPMNTSAVNDRIIVACNCPSCHISWNYTYRLDVSLLSK